MDLGGSRRSAFFAVAVAVAVTAIGGCGGDSATPATGGGQAYDPEAATITVASPPLTKAQFIDRANEICRAAWPEVTEYWTGFVEWQSPKKSWAEKSGKERFDMAVYYSLLTGADFYLYDKIVELGAPAGEEEEIEAIIGPFYDIVELGRKKRWHAYSVAEVTDRFRPYNERAKQYGLDDCPVEADHLHLQKLDA